MTKANIMIRLLFLALTSMLFSNVFSQSAFHISGRVMDTVEKKGLENANIVLIKASDSVLVQSIRSTHEGKFELSNIPTGAYLIMASYPKFAQFIDRVEVINEDKDLGVMPMVTAFFLMKEIIIKNSIAAIKIKGDTTEFTADSFRVTPNADVQELLRKMPGFQVNAKGEITAYGEKVQKVLVDGEEFFSDDPAVVTKNLRADAIDKVQVFDKKSDQAAFTGIEDGQRTKTINLKIKEDKKNGYFGKIEAGSNFGQYSNGKLMANSFKGKRKLAAYATTANNQFEGLDWGESRAYGDGGNFVSEVDEDGSVMMMYSGEGNDEDNKGLPNQQTVGAFYGNKWNNTSTANSGQYQRLGTDLNASAFTKTLLDGYTLDSYQENVQLLDKKRYKLSSTNEWGTDSTGLFKIVVKGANTLKDVNSFNSAKTLLDNQTKINQSSRATSFSENDKQLTSSLSFRKKFDKKGRSLSFTSDLNFNDKTQEGSLQADNIFYALGLPERLENIDQRKSANQLGTSIATNFIFTEPISKKSFLLFKYGLSIGKNDAERNTFSKNSAGEYANLVDSLSNHFKFNTFNNNASINYRYVAKKMNFVLGSGAGRVNYQAANIENFTEQSISFNNLLPSFSINFKPKQQRNISVDYNGSTINPTLQQIQPLIDNADPLNITVGNQDLVQGFTNRVNIRMSDFKVLKSRYVAINGNFSNTANAITNSSDIDASGKRISKYVNVNGSFQYGLNFEYMMDLLNGIQGGFSASRNNSRYINFINGLKNTNDNKLSSYSLNLQYWGDRWYSFYTVFSVANNRTSSSIQTGIISKYTTYSVYESFSIKFKKAKLYIDLFGDLRMYSKTDVFVNPRTLFLFNPSVRKVLTKNDALEAKITVFDLFNRNNDIQRNINSNFISENINNVIKRYFMLGVVYNFKSKSSAVEVK